MGKEEKNLVKPTAQKAQGQGQLGPISQGQAVGQGKKVLLGHSNGSTVFISGNRGKTFSCQCGGKFKGGSCGLLDVGRWAAEEDLAALQHETTDVHQAWIRRYVIEKKRFPDRHEERRKREKIINEEKRISQEKSDKRWSKKIACGCGVMICQDL